MQRLPPAAVQPQPCSFGLWRALTTDCKAALPGVRGYPPPRGSRLEPRGVGAERRDCGLEGEV